MKPSFSTSQILYSSQQNANPHLKLNNPSQQKRNPYLLDNKEASFTFSPSSKPIDHQHETTQHNIDKERFNNIINKRWNKERELKNENILTTGMSFNTVENWRPAGKYIPTKAQTTERIDRKRYIPEFSHRTDINRWRNPITQDDETFKNNIPPRGPKQGEFKYPSSEMWKHSDKMNLMPWERVHPINSGLRTEKLNNNTARKFQHMKSDIQFDCTNNTNLESNNVNIKRGPKCIKEETLYNKMKNGSMSDIFGHTSDYPEIFKTNDRKIAVLNNAEISFKHAGIASKENKTLNNNYQRKEQGSSNMFQSMG